MFIDTHCHLYAEDFDEDRAEVVARAFEAGAEKILLPNIDANTVGPMLAVCDEWPELCCPMMGLHPTELPPNPTPLLDQMERMLMVKDNPFIAIGEVGVDLYWDASRREASAFNRRSSSICAQPIPNCLKSCHLSKTNFQVASSIVLVEVRRKRKSYLLSNASISALVG